jgi:hypothetical protein
MNLAIAFVCFHAFGVSGISAAEPTIKSDYMPENLYLVRATVIEVRKKKPMESHDVGQLRIDDVVDGPDSFKGKQFTCLIGNIFQFGSTQKTYVDGAVSQLEKGVEGLWWVYMDQDGKTVLPELRRDLHENVTALRLNRFPYLKMPGAYWEIRDPAINNIEWEKLKKARYEEIVKQGELWAETVVALRNAKSDDDRRAMFEKIAATENSPMAGWAVALLSRGPMKEAVAFLTKLAENTKVTPDAQATIDRKLCRIDPMGWKTSETCKAMLIRWLADDSQYRELLTAGSNRIRDAIGLKEIDEPMLVSVLATVTARAAKLKDYEIGNFKMLLDHARFLITDRPVRFDFLVALARDSKDEEIRVTAAYDLRLFKPLTADEEKTIVKIRDEVTGAELKKFLDRLIAIPPKK